MAAYSDLLHMRDIEFAHIDEVTCDCCRSGHDRADQMRARIATLPPFEIAIRSAGAALLRRQNIRVHADAHAAPRIAPFESRLREHLIESFFFRLRLDSSRTRHDQCLCDVLCYMLAGYPVGRRAKIIQARVGTRADDA